MLRARETSFQIYFTLSQVVLRSCLMIIGLVPVALFGEMPPASIPLHFAVMDSL